MIFQVLALLLSAATLSGEEVTIKGSIGNLPQGDEVFIDILEQLGVSVTNQMMKKLKLNHLKN